MKNVYLTMAILGAIAPYLFFAKFFVEDEFGLAEFIHQLFATAPAAGFTMDLLITSTVFWIWSFPEARRLDIKRWWSFVAINLLIGLSCAFPLFLYARAVAIERQE